LKRMTKKRKYIKCAAIVILTIAGSLIHSVSLAQTASFTVVDDSVCFSAPVVAFTNTSTGDQSWTWDFGDGSPISTVENPSNTYTATGQYTVTLTAFDGPNQTGNSDVATAIITILTLPTANLSADVTEGCIPFDVCFTDLSTPGDGTVTSWLWDFGDLGASTNQSPCHTFTSIANCPSGCDILLVVTDENGCTGSINMPDLIILRNQPNASFTFTPGFACNVPATFSFDGTTSTSGGIIANYDWDFGDSNNGTGSTTTNTYNSTGTFNVQLNITDDIGCEDSVTIPVYIDDLQGGFHSPSATYSGCIPFNFTVQDTSTGTTPPNSWLWDFTYTGTFTPNGVGPNSAFSYGTPGTYTVALVTSNGLCSDTIIMTDLVEVFDLPNPAFTIDTSVSCSNPFCVTFEDLTLGIVNRTWFFGDSNTDTAKISTHCYLTTGTFTVTLSVTDTNGCSSAISFIDTIKITSPIADFDADTFDFQTTFTEGCVPLQINFRDLSTFDNILIPDDSIVTWLWDFGDGDSIMGPDTTIPDSTNDCKTLCTYPDPTHIYVDTGSFDVTLIVITAKGCSDTLTLPGFVKVGVPPIVNFTTSDTVGCQPFETKFYSASSNFADEWWWDFGDGNTGQIEDPTNTYYDTGFFTISHVAIYYTCPSDTLVRDSVIFVQAPKPLFNTAPIDTLVGVTHYCYEDSLPLGGWKITVTDSSYGANVWIWNMGDTNTTYAIDTVFTQFVDTTFVPADTLVNLPDTLSFKAGDSLTCDTVFEVIRGLDSVFVDADTIPPAPADTSIFNIQGDYIHWKWIANCMRHIIEYFFNFIPPEDTVIDSIYTIITSATYDTIFADTVDYGCNTQLTDPQVVLTHPIDTFVTTDSSDFLDFIFIDSFTLKVDTTITQPDTIKYSSLDTLVSYSSTVVTIGGVTLFINSDTMTIDTVVWVSPEDTLFLGLDTVPEDTIITTTITTVLADTVLSGCLTKIIAAVNDTVADTTYTDTIRPIVLEHIYRTSGTKTIWLYTLRVCAGCPDSLCIDSIQHQVFISEIHADFQISGGSVNDTLGCVPFIASFTDQTTSNYTHVTGYDYGDGQQGISTFHFYTQPGTYRVTIGVMDSLGCVDSLSKELVVLPVPDPDLIADTLIGCSGDLLKDDLTVTFTDTSATWPPQNITWTWNFGDGNFETTTIPQSSPHSYTLAPDTFTAILIVTDTNTCAAQRSITIITTAPTSNFVVTNPICSGTPLGAMLIDTIPNATYYWDWCDTTTNIVDTTYNDTAASYTYIVDTTTTFNITLTVVDSNGCSDTSSVPITVNQPISEIVIGYLPSDCNKVIPFLYDSISSNTVNITWDFGDGTPPQSKPYVVGDSATHPYLNPGVYTVIQTITDNFGCTDADTLSITIPGPIILSITGIPDTIFCTPDTATFTVKTVNTYLYILDYDDGVIDSFFIDTSVTNFADTNTFTFTHVYTYTDGTPFTPSITVWDPFWFPTDSCSDNDFFDPIIVLGPNVDFFTADTLCGPRDVGFANTSQGIADVDLWYWDFGDGYTIEGAGNIPSGTNNDLTTGTYYEPNHNYTQAGIYYVTLKATIIGNGDTCTYEITKPNYITVIGFPYARVSDCPPHTVNFNADAIQIDTSMLPFSLDSIWWDFGDGSAQQQGYSTSHTYASTGESINTTYYTVQAILDSNCKFVFDSMVAIYPTPIADFYIEPVVSGFSVSVNLINTSTGGDKFDWDFDDDNNATTYSSNPNVSHAYTDSGTYTIQLIAFNNLGCSDTTEQVKRISLKIPNVFNPGSGTAENSVFYIGDFYLDTLDLTGAVLELVVFNRWNEKVYENDHYEDCDPFNAPGNCWDGTDLKGNELQTDTYFYVLNLNNQSAVNGYVMILRPGK